MSTAQAQQFADSVTGYTVVAQYSDATGLSATVFKDASGQKYLAVRGTEFALNDLLTDAVDIAVLGTTHYQSQYASLKAKVTEWIGDGTLSSSFTVTGHSLGGFLATGIAADFPSNVSHAYLYNSPGLGGILASVLPFDALRSALGIGTTTLDLAKISNIKAAAGPSPISGLGVQVAPTIFIVIEDQLGDVPNPPAARNHSLQPLTDAIALYATFAKLDPNLSAANFNTLLKSDSDKNHLTLESGLDALRKLLLGPTTAATTTDNRNALYTNLYALQGSGAYTALVGNAHLTVFADKSLAQIIDLASTSDAQGLAERYALNSLNPFALNGVNYTALNTDHALDLHDAGTNSGAFTQNYLPDRASFLQRKLWFNTQDKNPLNRTIDITREGLDFFETDGTYFIDADSGYRIAQGFAPEMPFPNIRRFYFGGANGDSFTGGSVTDHLYGGAGNDDLNGAGGNDYLQGDAGNDILSGGTGNDTLAGGADADTYLWNSGDGNDIILDDGSSRILINGQASELFYKQADGSWQSPDSKVTLTHNTTWKFTMQDGGSLDLGASLNDGDFGIHLLDALPSPTFTPIVGDLAPELINGAPHTNGLGNIITNGQPQDNRADHLYGHDDANGSDLIKGFGGDDVIEARGGDDIAVGGSGSDIVGGGAGNDLLYGDIQLSLDQAYTRSETEDAINARGDWVDGRDGNDQLIGSAAADVLSGGQGSDLLIGGAGDDILLGDTQLDGASNDWSASRSINGSTYTYQFSRAQISSVGPGADDVLYGGAGDDWLLGEGGNDVLDGGSGNDVLFGGAGDDILTGQAGNDILVGDGGDVAISQQGNDWLDGGDGNDTLSGNAGNGQLTGGSDIYTLNSGDGKDTLTETTDPADVDVLRFGTGITAAGVSVVRQGNNLVLSANGGADQITIANAYSGTRSLGASVERIEFADGTVWTEADLRTKQLANATAANAEAWRQCA